MKSQSINNLSLSDLESLIETIVRRTIKQESISNQPKLEQSFQETFGQWQDEKDDEKIINEIYESRNIKIEE
jgi:hypothetical protein